MLTADRSFDARCQMNVQCPNPNAKLQKAGMTEYWNNETTGKKKTEVTIQETEQSQGTQENMRMPSDLSCAT